jgi:spermidine synthase
LYRWERGFEFPDWSTFRAARSGERFLFSRDDADATVAVTERDTVRVLRVNGKPDASNGGDLPSQLMVGHIPMFLHPDPKKVMVVGLGSGATAGAVLRHEGASVSVAEISPQVIRAAAFFEGVNDRILHNPRMSLALVDAREYLLLERQSYDVIISEPTNVWIPGVAALFTQEFYGVVRERLAPGGLFAQWLPLYSSEPGIVASAAVSLQRSFPFVSVWMIADGDLVFVAGQQRPRFDPSDFARRIERVRPSRGMPAHPGVLALDDPIEFLSSQVATGEGSRAYWAPSGAGPYRDLFPRLEFLAARAQFVGRPFVLWSHLDERVLPRAPEPLFLAEYLARFSPGAPERRRLIDRFSQSGVNVRLAKSLSLIEALGAEPAPDAWTRVPEPSRGQVLLSRALQDRVRSGLADAASCLAFVEAEGATVVSSASVFGRLPTQALVQGTEACARAHPAIGPRLQSRLVALLAEAGASEEALGRLEALVAGGALDQLATEDRAVLIDWGSRLNRRLGRVEEAERWLAQRPG